MNNRFVFFLCASVGSAIGDYIYDGSIGGLTVAAILAYGFSAICMPDRNNARGETE